MTYQQSADYRPARANHPFCAPQVALLQPGHLNPI